jgi:choice-of-anchor C domain-containing protein
MKVGKTAILAFVAVAFISGLLTKANANLILNGSFENGIDPGAMDILPPGSTNVSDWTVTRGGVDYKGTFWDAFDGVRSIDLDNSPGFGGIMQTFATTPQVRYLVTFAMSGNPYTDFGDPSMKHMRVEAAGQSADFSFETAGHWYDNMGWVTHSWWFTADSNSTTLEFYSLHTLAGGEYSGYSGWCGAALDNVSVVPEPTTVALLGLGALSLVRKRRVYMQRKGELK